MSAAADPTDTGGANPQDGARADLYALLAHLFFAPPPTELLNSIAMADDIGAEAPDTPLARAWHRLQAAATVADTPAVGQEFQDLFIGVGGGEVIPYGSWHLTGFLMEEPLARLRADLAQLGLSRLQSTAESEDHIAALAEVMRMLIAGGPGEATAGFETQKVFFAHHLLPWYRGFIGQLQGAPRASFYRVVGELAQAFLDTEAAYFEAYE
jgi:TorA maturation chaperone TorD